MKLFAPPYYRDFECIADRCKHSCCVGWEIDVDEDTLRRYRTLSEEARDGILSTIDEDGGEAHFRMCEDGRCPHLNGCGLCNIIIEHGEEYLSDICREHPRFYNFPSGRAEVGLGAACEEAARLILECEDYYRIECVGELSGCADAPELDSVSERDGLYRILSDSSLSYSERRRLICERYLIGEISPTKTKRILCSLEYLCESDRALFLSTVYTNASRKTAKYRERSLAYFVYRHASSAETPAEFRAAVALSLFLESLFGALLEKSEKRDTDTAISLLRTVSEEIEYSEDNVETIKLMLL